MTDTIWFEMNCAVRALGMLAMSPAELDELVAAHEADARTMFASRVIVQAAQQIATSKRLMGAENESFKTIS